MKLQEFKDLVVKTKYKTEKEVWFSTEAWDSFYKALKEDIILNIKSGAEAVDIHIGFPKEVNNAIVAFLTKVFSGFDIAVPDSRTVKIFDPNSPATSHKTIIIRHFPNKNLF